MTFVARMLGRLIIDYDVQLHKADVQAPHFLKIRLQLKLYVGLVTPPCSATERMTFPNFLTISLMMMT